MFIQFSKYGGVAVASALMDYFIFTLLYFLGVNVIFCQMTARISGGLLSFFSNKFLTFGNRQNISIAVEGRRFLVLYAFSYCLSVGAIYILISHLNILPYPSKILSDILCFVLNFVVMKHYVFSARGGISRLAKKLLVGRPKSPKAK
ncbi:MAG: hypothetical protein CFH06_00155 [Alphaproteobacteria bacterium MarineAlpha3_Bin5]|nr:MAG: hypothetical protein CFH06_00155 [Alphaproteobacteria bacterium MarineAlpha3_Bin5]